MNKRSVIFMSFPNDVVKLVETIYQGGLYAYNKNTEKTIYICTPHKFSGKTYAFDIGHLSDNLNKSIVELFDVPILTVEENHLSLGEINGYNFFMGELTERMKKDWLRIKT